jgi:HK97 family phage major capsid protein
MAEDTKSPAELAAEIKSAFDKSLDAVRGIAEEALGKAGSGEKLTESLKTKADEALTGMNALKAQLTEIEQKMARTPGGDEAPTETAGQAFVNSDEFKAFAATGFAKNRAARIETKATLTNSTAAAAGSLGAALVTTRVPGVVELPQRQLTIRALLAPGNMDGQTLEFVREHSATAGAGMVAEGAAKPASDFRLEAVSTSARVVAHHMKVSRQSLSDVAMLRSMIDSRLSYGLDYKEEDQLLNGDGTGQNLLGLIPQATAYTNPLASGDSTSIDKIMLMALQAALALLPADGVVMNPADWAWIQLLKDSTGRYILGNPQGQIGATLWGLPVVVTPAMTIDKVLVGAFRTAAQIFDRWTTTIETGYENDDFTKNLVTVLAEKRLVLATYRPGAFIYGDFGRVA